MLFCSVILMGLSRRNFDFKEVLLLYLVILIIVNYLYFIKDTERTDVFDLLFPQMTITQLRTCLFENFYVIITFLECRLSRLPRELR